MQMVISTGGIVRCVYAEVIDLNSLGRMHIRRGSHVEPDTHGRWRVDLSPVGGPCLGSHRHRSEALAAEQQWLEDRWLPSVASCRRIQERARSPQPSDPA